MQYVSAARWRHIPSLEFNALAVVIVDGLTYIACQILMSQFPTSSGFCQACSAVVQSRDSCSDRYCRRRDDFPESGSSHALEDRTMRYSPQLRLYTLRKIFTYLRTMDMSISTIYMNI